MRGTAVELDHHSPVFPRTVEQSCCWSHWQHAESLIEPEIGAMAMAGTSERRLCAAIDNTLGPHAGDCHGGLDFTLLFEEAVLTILPIAVCILVLPLRIRFLSKRKPKIPSYNRLATAKLVCLNLPVSIHIPIIVCRPQIHRGCSCSTSTTDFPKLHTLTLILSRTRAVGLGHPCCTAARRLGAVDESRGRAYAGLRCNRSGHNRFHFCVLLPFLY